ncbi:hypothetical protein [Clostridium sp. Marseille-P2415]|uniref:hypothetical protein n=1 Tax=Clostridium sp. Marseille-P2415 TaxID=1805471 RepID=UPI0011156E3C|nr:hypothetical protein [Clostridium sp. Marseille-P2415]
MEITKRETLSIDSSGLDKLTGEDGTSYFSVISKKTITRELKLFCNTFKHAIFNLEKSTFLRKEQRWRNMNK